MGEPIFSIPASGLFLLQGGGPGGDFGLGGLGPGFLVLMAFAVLALNIWATLSAATGRLSTLAKVLWILGIWLFTPFGALLYVLLGRTRSGR